MTAGGLPTPLGGVGVVTRLPWPVPPSSHLDNRRQVGGTSLDSCHGRWAGPRLIRATDLALQVRVPWCDARPPHEPPERGPCHCGWACRGPDPEGGMPFAAHPATARPPRPDRTPSSDCAPPNRPAAP